MDIILPNFVYTLIMTRSRLGLLPVIFRKFVTEFGPWLMSAFRSHSISLEQMDTISSDFVYALVLKRSRLGMLLVICRKFVTELWPLIDVRFAFPLNIFRTKFCVCIYIAKIYVGIFTCHFSQISIWLKFTVFFCRLEKCWGGVWSDSLT